MRAWQLIAAGLLIALVAYQAGYSRGQVDCPAKAHADAAHQAAIDRDVAALFSAPDDRSLTCDRIFEMVGDELSRETLGGQSYLDALD